MNRKISTKDVPAHLIHKKGPNKGNLRQDLLQVKGVELTCGMTHPDFGENLIYVQTNRSSGKQQWTTRSRNNWRRARNQYVSLAHYHRTKKLKRYAK